MSCDCFSWVSLLNWILTIYTYFRIKIIMQVQQQVCSVLLLILLYHLDTAAILLCIICCLAGERRRALYFKWCFILYLLFYVFLETFVNALRMIQIRLLDSCSLPFVHQLFLLTYFARKGLDDAYVCTMHTSLGKKIMYAVHQNLSLKKAWLEI